MATALTKHLFSCIDCEESFYVLNDAASEAVPRFCPFCQSENIGDFIPPAEKAESEEDKE